MGANFSVSWRRLTNLLTTLLGVVFLSLSWCWRPSRLQSNGCQSMWHRCSYCCCAENFFSISLVVGPNLHLIRTVWRNSNTSLSLSPLCNHDYSCCCCTGTWSPVTWIDKHQCRHFFAQLAEVVRGQYSNISSSSQLLSAALTNQQLYNSKSVVRVAVLCVRRQLLPVKCVQSFAFALSIFTGVCEQL